MKKTEQKRGNREKTSTKADKDLSPEELEKVSGGWVPGPGAHPAPINPNDRKIRHEGGYGAP